MACVIIPLFIFYVFNSWCWDFVFQSGIRIDEDKQGQRCIQQ